MSTGAEQAALHGILLASRVPDDAVLVVHSAIGGLSRQGFRAEAMIDALLAYLSRGTLLMPTMTWRTVNEANPMFDEMGTPSHTGVLTEVFRTKYSSARSLHPTHSAAGVGPAAAALLSTHHLGSTPVPATSPYALMRDYPAWILMVGVGLECVTAIHHPEEVIAPDLYLRPVEEAQQYWLVDRVGKVCQFSLRRHRYTKDRDFPRFGPLLAAKGQIRTGEILGVPWKLVRAADLLLEVFARLVEQPDFNLQPSASRRS